MWPARVSNPGPLAMESDALSTALRGPVKIQVAGAKSTMYGLLICVQEGSHLLNSIAQRGTRNENLIFIGSCYIFFKIPCSFFFASYMIQKAHQSTYL